MGDAREQSRQAYNEKAEHYEDTFDGRYTQGFKQVLLRRVTLRRGFRVLDVACGTGTLLQALAQKESIHGYGVDIAERMIEVAASRYPEMQWSVADCTTLPVEDTSQDVITVSAAFHHFPDPKGFAAEAARILRPGGTLYIAEVGLPPVVRHAFNLILPLYRAGDVKVYGAKELARFFQGLFTTVAVEKHDNILLLTAVK